jgi:hypothetical protein
MRDDSSVRKLVEPTESLFSDTEAPTSCMRPTPFLPPPSSDLRGLGREAAKVSSSGTRPVQAPLAPRMVGLGELNTSLAVDAVNELLAKRRVRARASIHDAVPPMAAVVIDPPTCGNVRSVIERNALLLVLDKLLGFIGHVFGPRVRQCPAGAPSEHRRSQDDAANLPFQSGSRPIPKLPLVPPARRTERDIP